MTMPTGDWDSAYRQQEPAPWDIGRPQPPFVAVVEQGLLTGTILDAGCGTGENALLLATRGGRVTGVDLSETAISRARQNAADRGLAASFVVGDILTIPLPESGFDAVVDSGLFHVFSDEDRKRYVTVLAGALRRGGLCCLMCFSDRQPGDWGPRRVTRAELEEAFADGWALESLEPAVFDINPTFGMTTVQAWRAMIRRSP